MYECIERNGKQIAVFAGDELLLKSEQDALDLIGTVRYETGCTRLAIDKRAIPEDFFILSTGLAGGILQKFINYQAKLAIFGDFSGYTSKPLKDFIFESNKGTDIFFAVTQIEALEKLASV